MPDMEVERLRRLRAAALRVRAVAQALGSYDPLLDRGRCTAWRVARTVSGRLRSHPYASFQRDAGIGVLVANSLVAANSVLGVKTRQQALLRFEEHLRALMRELSDIRALTHAPDLNECFARSQIEIRALLAALAHETRAVHLPEAPAIIKLADPEPAGGGLQTDWPYLAL